VLVLSHPPLVTCARLEWRASDRPWVVMAPEKRLCSAWVCSLEGEPRRRRGAAPNSRGPPCLRHTMGPIIRRVASGSLCEDARRGGRLETVSLRAARVQEGFLR
jgi:hypothetical protein